MGRFVKFILVALVFVCLLLLPYLIWAGRAILVSDTINPFVDPFATILFNRHDWLEDDLCSDNTNRRGHMVRDIIEHHLHKGMTKAEVMDLLGKTKEEDQASIFDAEMIRTMHSRPHAQAYTALNYYLGQDIGVMHGVGRAWLFLYFDRQNHYVDWKILQP